jgi:hypothetical protein
MFYQDVASAENDARGKESGDCTWRMVVSSVVESKGRCRARPLLWLKFVTGNAVPKCNTKHSQMQRLFQYLLYLVVYLPTYLSVCMSIRLSTFVSTCMSIYIYIFIYLFIYPMFWTWLIGLKECIVSFTVLIYYISYYFKQKINTLNDLQWQSREFPLWM